MIRRLNRGNAARSPQVRVAYQLREDFLCTHDQDLQLSAVWPFVVSSTLKTAQLDVVEPTAGVWRVGHGEVLCLHVEAVVQATIPLCILETRLSPVRRPPYGRGGHGGDRRCGASRGTNRPSSGAAAVRSRTAFAS